MSEPDEPQVDPRAIVGAKVRLNCPDCGQELITEVVDVATWPETINRPAAPAPIIRWHGTGRRWAHINDLELIQREEEQ